MNRSFLLSVVLLLAVLVARAEEEKPPVRFAIFGLSHDHAAGFIPRAKNRKDILLVGIIEPRADLVSRYAERYQLDRSLFYSSLDELLAKTNIQAVATFTSTFEHRRVVELCAAKGINVMMEKPLAVNIEHARAIETAANKGHIQVIVNYETTWYPGNHAAYALLNDQHALGDARKIVVHDGHRGPKEIGCSPAFLDWLTDPVLNGGGALTDFGCYGADLITWLMQGQRPTSVLAVTQHFKPDVYPKVEDEATIVVTYPRPKALSRPPGTGHSIARTWKSMVNPVTSLCRIRMCYACANPTARRPKRLRRPWRGPKPTRSLTWRRWFVANSSPQASLRFR